MSETIDLSNDTTNEVENDHDRQLNSSAVFTKKTNVRPSSKKTNVRPSPFQLTPEIFVEWVSYFVNKKRTVQPWNLNRIEAKKSYEDTMQVVVENGTHTTAFLKSPLSKKITLKYDFFQDKIKNLVHNQVKPMKAIRDETLSQLKETKVPIDNKMLKENTILAASLETSFLPLFAPFCSIIPAHLKNNPKSMLDLRIKYASHIYDISCEEYRAGLGKDDQTALTREYNSNMLKVDADKLDKTIKSFGVDGKKRKSFEEEDSEDDEDVHMQVPEILVIAKKTGSFKSPPALKNGISNKSESTSSASTNGGMQMLRVVQEFVTNRPALGLVSSNTNDANKQKIREDCVEFIQKLPSFVSEEMYEEVKSMLSTQIGESITIATLTFLPIENKQLIANNLKPSLKRMYESAFIN